MVKNHIDNDLTLYEKCRELSLNFIWLYQSLNKLSPTIDYSNQEKFCLFPCIYSEMIEDSGDFDFPLSVIEFKRFLRIVQKIETLKFSAEELKNLTKGCKSLFNSKRFGDYILYDRFLLAVRGATLKKEEIKIQMNYEDPLEQEEVIEEPEEQEV